MFKVNADDLDFFFEKNIDVLWNDSEHSILSSVLYIKTECGQRIHLLQEKIFLEKIAGVYLNNEIVRDQKKI